MINILNNLCYDVIVINKKRKIVFINTFLFSKLVASDSEIIGEDLLEVISFSNNNFENILKNIDNNNEFNFCFKDKYHLHLNFTGKIIEDKFDNQNCYFIIVKDKELQYYEKNKMKSNYYKSIEKVRDEFLSNITHEFRTPINIIQGTVQLIEKGLKNNTYNMTKLEKHIKYLNKNSNRLLRLVNNLVDITYIKNGYHELNLKNQDIIKLVEDICNSVTKSERDQGINLIFDTNCEEQIIACDEDEIERILLNLISNAIKYSPQGEKIEVNVNVESDNVKIEVKDYGIGISKENLDIIFEDLTRLDNNMNRKNEGSGIGLAIVRSLVDLHNGTINVESELGNGSRFEIVLPITYLENENLMDNSIPRTNKVEKCNIEFSDIYYYN